MLAPWAEVDYTLTQMEPYNYRPWLRGIQAEGEAQHIPRVIPRLHAIPFNRAEALYHAATVPQPLHDAGTLLDFVIYGAQELVQEIVARYRILALRKQVREVWKIQSPEDEDRFQAFLQTNEGRIYQLSREFARES